jgi:hypothetical protein
MNFSLAVNIESSCVGGEYYISSVQIRDVIDEWVPVTTALCVLRLLMEERRPIRRAVADIRQEVELLIGFGRGANNSTP